MNQLRLLISRRPVREQIIVLVTFWAFAFTCCFFWVGGLRLTWSELQSQQRIYAQQALAWKSVEADAGKLKGVIKDLKTKASLDKTQLLTAVKELFAAAGIPTEVEPLADQKQVGMTLHILVVKLARIDFDTMLSLLAQLEKTSTPIRIERIKIDSVRMGTPALNVAIYVASQT